MDHTMWRIQNSTQEQVTDKEPEKLPDPKVEAMKDRIPDKVYTEVTITPPEKVPIRQVALNQVSSKHKWVSVVDLENTFFCLPLDPESRVLFAFMYQGRQCTYTRMPQGFKGTPTIFNACLKNYLKDLPLPGGVVLLQYVDDLLLAAPTKAACLEATEALLRRVGDKGYNF